MTEFNPIFEALDGLDENIAAEAVRPAKKKMKKPLKIAIIAVAATLALGMSAVAATSGSNPIIKINKRQISGDYEEYVNSEGYTVKTVAAVIPQSDMPTYRPIGKIRAEYVDGSFYFYDELGVKINDIAEDTAFYGTSSKDNKVLDSHAKGYESPDYLEGIMTVAADYSYVEYTEWVNLIKYAEYKSNTAKWNRLSLQEKIDFYNMELEAAGVNYYNDYGGISHPTTKEQLALNGIGHFSAGDNQITGPDGVFYDPFNAYSFENTPTEIFKLFGFDPLAVEEMSENKCRCFAMLYYDQELKEFTQGIYQYTLTDDETGAPIEFTAWHYADKRECHTDHFDFDYEYVTLDSGAEARIHRSVNGSYIAEFEKDGAAYAFTTDLDRGIVIRILNNLT